LKPPRSQRGLALISALLVVSLAGVLGTARMFSLQMESQSSRTLIGSARARMMALGIEELAAEMLAADARASASDHRGERWAQGISESIPGQGMFRGSMEDMQGRFNVNNLVTFHGTADMIAVAQFQRLLRILDLDDTLAYKALDWMDADNLPQPLAGAEDEAYTRLDPPYQAPNRPLEDVSELLAVEGFSATVWSVLAPHITALPVPGQPTPINLNTASESVLLSLADDLDPVRARFWLESQKSGGISDLAEAQRALPSSMADRVAIASHWFQLRVAINVEGARFFLASLLDRESGTVRTRWRRQGIPAEAWLAQRPPQGTER